jgi:hypothetical protein
LAFTELDRAFVVTRSLGVSRDAARTRLQAEAERHAAGDTHIENVLKAQTRATQADTAYLRSLVDYNLAFIKLHFVRGTLLQMLGVGFVDCETSDETVFVHDAPSPFAAAGGHDRPTSPEPVTGQFGSIARANEAGQPPH